MGGRICNGCLPGQRLESGSRQVVDTYSLGGPHRLFHRKLIQLPSSESRALEAQGYIAKCLLPPHLHLAAVLLLPSQCSSASCEEPQLGFWAPICCCLAHPTRLLLHGDCHHSNVPTFLLLMELAQNIKAEKHFLSPGWHLVSRDRAGLHVYFGGFL